MYTSICHSHFCGINMVFAISCNIDNETKENIGSLLSFSLQYSCSICFPTSYQNELAIEKKIKGIFKFFASIHMDQQNNEKKEKHQFFTILQFAIILFSLFHNYIVIICRNPTFCDNTSQ